MEAEEEFDFLATDDLAHRFHRALAARTFEWIATPDFQYEVTPEGAHVAGGLLRRRGDEEDFGRGRFFGRGRDFGRADDAVRDRGGLAAGSVGVEAVVADGLLALPSSPRL